MQLRAGDDPHLNELDVHAPLPVQQPISIMVPTAEQKQFEDQKLQRLAGGQHMNSLNQS